LEFVPEHQHGSNLLAAGAPSLVVRSQPGEVKSSRRTVRSTAADIATRTHEDIANGLYECPICTGELGRKSRVWSCKFCWTVFHLSCIKKWSQNEGSAFQDHQQEDGAIMTRHWRCPGCNLPQEILPSTYSCWCEKDIDPTLLPGLPPHSCGQTCSRSRRGCPHPCDSICHAGPCSPCRSMGPSQDCFCGKNTSTKRCVDTDYVNGWSCGRTCGDLLPCGKHACPRPCHEGLCGACEVQVDVKCYCGKVETQRLCKDIGEEFISQQLAADSSEPSSGLLEKWIGSFDCGEVCNRLFDCGIHSCPKSCHPRDARPAHCPKSPDVVVTCPCGKTLLSSLDGFSRRTTCEDPISNCTEPCGKTLPCGHNCPMVCHSGPCLPCLATVPINCCCGRGTFMSVCHQGQEEPPQCFRICKAFMNCGRHTCMERCCPGERRAIERQATKRKLKSLNATNRSMDNDIEAEHICTRVCGRLLKCGRHTCPELCHKGACGTCKEAIFEEIWCHCERSVLYPPQPCGTKPPVCHFECERPKDCDHPQVPHDCHPDEESCPKCPFLMEKRCVCGKKILKNQPCWLVDTRCGLACGKPLKCGSHSCLKSCHRPGNCEDTVMSCQQPCGKAKRICGHPCMEPCHAPYPCPEKIPCSASVTITCGCGRLRRESSCNAARAVTLKGQLHQPEILPSPMSLNCDDECARLERNRSLASALNITIDQPTTTALNPPSSSVSSSHLPYSAETLDMYVQLSSSSTLSALQSYESTLHDLAVNATQRSVRFQPARAPLRAFIHSLASDWGFTSEGFDPEPHRHVLVLKPTRWTAPSFGLSRGSAIGIGGMTVAGCLKFRDRERMKDREAQRSATAETKSWREVTSEPSLNATEGGWAQVASRRRPGADANASPALTRTSTPIPISGSTYSILSPDIGKDGKTSVLVLRSSVGTGKMPHLRNHASLDVDEVVDSWEEEVDKQEAAEQKASRHEHLGERGNASVANPAEGPP
jgi:transcriptional repressor NF-X1